MRILPARDDVLLVEVDDLDQALALHGSLRASPVPGVGRPVPGARTLLVPFDPWRVGARDLAAVLRDRVATARQAAGQPGSGAAGGRTVEIPTVYDGADLADVADLLGWSAEEVVRRHAAASWVVGFVGFAPGFAYLTSDDDGLVVPRRDTPRTRVPAGSVALAGPWSGVYPRESPGGWQLIGRTDVVTWDADRDPPTPWAPGDRVRFTVVRESVRGRSAGEVGGPGRDRWSGPPTSPRTTDLAGAAPSGPGLDVVTPGAQALLQDLGRPALEHLGVSASGAADPRSLRAANRAVGNPPGAAAVEAVGGLRLRARGPVVLALAGADADAVVHPAGAPDERRAAPFARPFLLADGDELALGHPARGWRTYVAVRGGVDAPPVLGSRATDTLAGLGPAPLGPATRLAAGPGGAADAVAAHDVGAPSPSTLPAPGEVTTLPLVLGPHDDWFDAASLALLAGQDWEVTARSDRVGLRLAGPSPLARTPDARGRELPSVGCVTGAVQVPPDGLPVLFGPDHPLTGGYPVVGAVASGHLWLLGQLPPGALVRFRPGATSPHS